MSEAVHTKERLAELRALPLWRKIQITQTRIIEWYQKFKGNVVVSFSGGKDSTVLLHLVRTLYPDVRAVFSNTGLEYPEIQKFARSFPNVDVVTPKMRFDQVISKYGYPLIGKEVSEAIHYARRIVRCKSSDYKRDELRGTGRTLHRRAVMLGREGLKEFAKKRESKMRDIEAVAKMYSKEKYLPLAHIPVPISHYCCNVIKKIPFLAYQRVHKVVPFLGTLTEESRMRTQAWIRHGCNAFDSKKPTSQPLSFWTEQDILQHIVDEGLEIASVYGEIVATDEDGNEYTPNSLLSDGKLRCTGCDRTGCIFCAFGFHLEKGETRFQRLARTHPRHYEYSIGGGQWVDNPAYDPAAPKYDGDWENWNPKKIWVPSKKGIGMGKVFDMVNELYGKDFYRYE